MVTALPDDTRFIPELAHKKVRIEGLQSAIVTGPSGEEIYTDEYGRVKVQFHWDRLGKHDETTTCWVRVADSWAGTNFGFIQVPRIGQEVMVEFMEGDPDRPVLTGRVYNADRMPPWKLPQQKTLSGIQSREFRAARRNQLVLDDTEGQIQAQLSSDHGLSQLNLGYLTRVNHVQGRDDFRGEGFELRTDNWGVVRAAKGLYISTYPRSGAEKHQRDLSEAIANLSVAAKQHTDTGKLAQTHQAQNYGEDCSPLASQLQKQSREVRGSGSPHDELSAAHLVLASPEGIALTTPNSTHIHTGEHTAITSERHTSISAGRSLLASALDKVSLFAHKLGMKLTAARGKVEIEAQSDDLTVIADKEVRIFSANERVRISSPKEIVLTAGGSYIKIGENGIEQGTSKEWEVFAASQSMAGPKTLSWLTKGWAKDDMSIGAHVSVRDELGRYLDINRYAKQGTGSIPADGAEHTLVLFHEQGGTQAEMGLAPNTQDSKVFTANGNILKLTPEHSNEKSPPPSPDEEEAQPADVETATEDSNAGGNMS